MKVKAFFRDNLTHLPRRPWRRWHSSATQRCCRQGPKCVFREAKLFKPDSLLIRWSVTPPTNSGLKALRASSRDFFIEQPRLAELQVLAHRYCILQSVRLGYYELLIQQRRLKIRKQLLPTPKRLQDDWRIPKPSSSFPLLIEIGKRLSLRWETPTASDNSASPHR